MVGGRSTSISALDKVYRKHASALENKTVTIADLGCGGGDLLRAIYVWAKAKRLKVNLIGIDANPFMVRYALQKSRAVGEIRFMDLNVFCDAFKAMRFDIACLNTFCHHLDDSDLIALFKQIEKQAGTAIVVND